MDIGPTLAAARSEAGLAIEEISARTRIRAKIISDIERDDYAACGGDFYARGHIRAIAKAIGIDPVPLIAEYDANAARRDQPPGAGEPEQGTPGPGDAARAPRLRRTGRPPGAASPAPVAAGPAISPPPGPGTGESGGGTGQSARTRAAGLAGSQARAVSAAARRAGTQARAAGASAYRRSASQARRAGTHARPWLRRAAGEASRRTAGLRTAERRSSVILAAVAAALAGLGILIYALVAGPASPPGGGVAAGSPSGGGLFPAVGPPTVTPATRQPTHQAVVALRPVSATAFGPGGTSRGDNPQQAAQALSGAGWHTDWYTTAHFGNLKSGTGLLLNMGKKVTVTNARITLGAASGGALQLRAGNTPVLSDLAPVARSGDRGGTLTLAPDHPVRARYVLIWFTSLPPDSFGTYQVTIYRVSLTGLS